MHTAVSPSTPTFAMANRLSVDCVTPWKPYWSFSVRASLWDVHCETVDPEFAFRVYEERWSFVQAQNLSDDE